MAEPGRRGGGRRRAGDRAGSAGAGASGESPELRRLRGRIDALDRRIVRLLNERADLGREVGREKRRQGRGVRDLEREREVLLRVAMANLGPLPQADLLAIYRRLVSATRRIEAADGAGGPLRRTPRHPVGTTETDREPASIRKAGTMGTPAGASRRGRRATLNVGVDGADDGLHGEPPAGGE